MFVDAFYIKKVNYVINKKKMRKYQQMPLIYHYELLINIKVFITCFNTVCKQLYNIDEIIVRLDRLSDLLFNKHNMIYNITNYKLQIIFGIAL